MIYCSREDNGSKIYSTVKLRKLPLAAHRNALPSEKQRQLSVHLGRTMCSGHRQIISRQLHDQVCSFNSPSKLPLQPEYINQTCMLDTNNIKVTLSREVLSNFAGLGRLEGSGSTQRSITCNKNTTQY